MATPQVQRQPETVQSFNSRQGPPPSFGASPLHSSSMGPGHNPGLGPNQGQAGFNQGPGLNQGPGFNQGSGLNQGPGVNQGPPQALQQYQAHQHERSFSQGPPIQAVQQSAGPMGRNGSGQYNSSALVNSGGPPQLSTLPFQNSSSLSTSILQASNIPQQAQISGKSNNLLPLRPVFGMSLEQLFDRDGSAVPLVIYQCIQAVNLYGLEVEGIYRLSGTTSHMNKIKAMFDNGG